MSDVMTGVTDLVEGLFDILMAILLPTTLGPLQFTLWGGIILSLVPAAIGILKRLRS